MIPVSLATLPVKIWRVTLVALMALSVGCAYFNTFYNAKTYYETGVKALETRVTASSNSIPKPASDAFGKAIEKSLIVIDEYPESRYIDDAFFIIGRSYFHRREFGMAERYLRQLLQEYPWSPFHDQAMIWLAKVHVQLGLYEAVEEDIALILAKPSPSEELLTEIYILRGDIALLQGDVTAAMNAFQEGVNLAVDAAQRAAIYDQLYVLAVDNEDYVAALDFLDKFARATPNESERVNARLIRVQLLQKMNDFEGAYKEIRNMVALTEFASIIPGLQLELGKIESIRGNRAAALERFIEVLEEFRNLPEASEAAFRAGEIYLTELHEIETARDYLRRVKNNSAYYLPAQTKLKQITTFSEINKKIHSLRAQLNPETDKEIDTTEASVDTTMIRRELAHALYRLGEIQLFEIELPDTALEVMAEIVSNFPDTDVAAQAAYVLYVHTQDNPDQAAFWRDLMLEQYPDSPYGRLLSNKSATMGDPRLDSLTAQVDEKVTRSPRQALNLFREIRNQFDTEQSYFAIAYIYDEYIGQLDSAITAYDEYLALYPSGTYSQDAGERLEFLRQIKASLSQ
ncbi:MAG: tetratricopeptide repeat protein [Fidelibacterota bacterium]|nr:MAG: tetratricopeptide repeat protein [Candidatus Neomarinimicrobiota bacterium]